MANIVNRVLQFGMHNAVINGVLQEGIPTTLTFVSDSEERDALDVLPGQFVATYGLENVWQMKGDGSWVDIING